MGTDVPGVAHRRADRRVPHQLLDRFHVHPLHQPVAAAESPQIVKTDLQPHPLGSSTQRLVGIHPSRPRPAVDENVRGVQVAHKSCQISGGVLRERYLPRLVVLGEFHSNQPAAQVHAFPGERQSFPLSNPRLADHRNHGLQVRIVHSIDQVTELRQKGGVAPVHLRFPRSARRGRKIWP